MQRLDQERDDARDRHFPLWTGIDLDFLSRRMIETRSGLTVIPGSVAEPYAETVARLQREGVPPPSEASRRLLDAVMTDDPRPLAQALRQGASPNAHAASPNFASALMIAVDRSAGQGAPPACLELLLKQPGIRVNDGDAFGATPLHLAAKHETGVQAPVVGALVAAGADPSKRMHFSGDTPVHVAMTSGEARHPDALQALRAAEAKRGTDSTAEYRAQRGLDPLAPAAGPAFDGPVR